MVVLRRRSLSFCLVPACACVVVWASKTQSNYDFVVEQLSGLECTFQSKFDKDQAMSLQAKAPPFAVGGSPSPSPSGRPSEPTPPRALNHVMELANAAMKSVQETQQISAPTATADAGGRTGEPQNNDASRMPSTRSVRDSSVSPFASKLPSRSSSPSEEETVRKWVHFHVATRVYGAVGTCRFAFFSLEVLKIGVRSHSFPHSRCDMLFEYVRTICLQNALQTVINKNAPIAAPEKFFSFDSTKKDQKCDHEHRRCERRTFGHSGIKKIRKLGGFCNKKLRVRVIFAAKPDSLLSDVFLSVFHYFSDFPRIGQILHEIH